jgi:hypothetical protein
MVHWVPHRNGDRAIKEQPRIAKLIIPSSRRWTATSMIPPASFDWAVPDEEVLDFITAAERDVGTYLYGAPCTR